MSFEPILEAKKVPEATKRRIKSVRDTQEAELRGTLMATDRLLENKSIRELAENYKIAPKTVRAELDLAYAKGFRERVEALISERLVPAALAVYEAHLHRGSLEAARDLLFGIGVLKKDHKGSSEPADAPIVTLEAYRLSRTVPGPPEGSQTP